MTLILTRASAEFVLQVTDRLITQDKQPHDRVANKNILYFASNAVVAIAYTGRAYLDDIPTDHWIAEKLAGITIDLEHPPAFKFGQNESSRDIGQSIRILRNELATRNQILKNQLRLFMTVHGWQWNSKGRFRPLVGCIGKAPGANTFGIHYEPRYWHLEGTSRTIAAPKGYILHEELTELANHLRHKSAPEVEGLLVDKIREVSQRSPLVGPHCISILLPPPSDPSISVRYLSAAPSASSESHRLADDQIVWAYSPWILGPRMCQPPLQIEGSPTFRYGPFSIHFASNAPKHPEYTFAVFGQKRRKWP